jgi:hypothetical protein
MARKSAIYSEATAANGRGLPMTVEHGVARRDSGMTPERLDAVIETLVKNAENGADLLNEYTPMLHGLMEKLRDSLTATFTLPEGASSTAIEPLPMPVLVDLAGKVSTIIERISKMTMQNVRSKDDAARLRMEMAKGPESADLEGLSENALRKMVIDAAAGFPKEPEAI